MKIEVQRKTKVKCCVCVLHGSAALWYTILLNETSIDFTH